MMSGLVEVAVAPNKEPIVIILRNIESTFAPTSQVVLFPELWAFKRTSNRNHPIGTRKARIVGEIINIDKILKKVSNNPG